MSNIKQQLEKDLKVALLAGDKELVSILRGLKSAILYEELAKGQRDKGFDDPDVITVLQKEAKKRQDSADLYEKGGNNERRDQELAEKTVIQQYLPAELTDEELNVLIDKAIETHGPLTGQTMGVIIGQTKQAAEGKADGGRIAAAVRQRLSS
jgi:uncharacterized protein